MRAQSNVKYDIEKLYDDINDKMKELVMRDHYPYAIIMHKQMFWDIRLTKDYFISGMRSPDSTKLFGYKVIEDNDMHIGEWGVLCKHD